MEPSDEANVADVLASVEHPTRQADGYTLDALFRKITGWQPKIWQGSILGYGQYRYQYESGRQGDFLATGFSPRNANLSIYIMPGYTDFPDLMMHLGKHKRGKACLYINKLADVDLDVLEQLIKAGIVDLGARWTVTPT
ncbi:DUF1801 domain-containing protein [Parasulfitobacter algicola]|uniref:DUF1801 domain-containing protein n=1 Tax=Parasulfitobacter algicola TaxID=2614809 RepID=A0ABX2IS93_9RHOB|nr:DUF1801 domain-containing protein [Sulfitobacter algicola]NSX55782.1 DUF1801 domain-containing protein [Sulfitobacter algicola]